MTIDCHNGFVKQNEVTNEPRLYLTPRRTTFIVIRPGPIPLWQVALKANASGNLECIPVVVILSIEVDASSVSVYRVVQILVPPSR